MKLSLSTQTIEAELTAARDQLDRILQNLAEGGIPGVTTPGGAEGEVHLAEWVLEFTGELMLVARKCENVAITLAEPPGST